MFLAQLTIFGFKSFAKKTEMTFGKGLSAIIGPNGCGKTNIVDAIRWVIGEQKIKSLRSSSLQDVIFKGTREEKPMSMAEVHLKLKDCQGILPYDPMAETVVIGRRYFRSGDSEYLVNGRQVRLKDIQSILMGTGIGSSVYALIERSMIQRILSGRKDDRRELFEEASGIMKYKVDRKASESKLQSTENDLARLGDIINEVEGNVAFLKRQMRRAKDLENLKGKASNLATQIASSEYTRLKKSLSEVSKELSVKEEEHAMSHAKKTELEARREILSADRDAKTAMVNKTGEALRKVESAIAQSEKEHAVLEERINNAQRGIESAKNTIRSQEDREKEFASQISDNEKRLNELRADLSSLKTKADDLALQHAQSEKLVTALRKQVFDIRNELSKDEADLARTTANIESASLQIQSFDLQIAQIKTDAFENSSALETKKKAFEEFSVRLEKHRSEYNTAKSKFDSAESELEKIRAQKSVIYDIIGKLGGEVVALSAKLNSLEEAAKRAEPDKALRERIITAGAIGKVAELIEPAEFPAPAIDLVLGDLASAWVVPNAQITEAVTQVFREAKIPAVLVVLDELHKSNTDSAVAKDGNKELLSLLEGWSLEQDAPKFVSHDGEFLRETGIRRIGKPAGSPVTKTAQLKAARNELALKEIEEKASRDKLQNIISDEEKARHTVEKSRTALVSTEKAFHEAERELREIEYEFRTLEGSIQSANKRIQDLTELRDKTSKSIEENSRAKLNLEKKCNELRLNLKELTDNQERAETETRERGKLATEEQMEYIRRKGEVDALEREIARLVLQRNESVLSAERADKLSKELSEELKDCNSSREKYREQIQTLFIDREQAEKSLNEAGIAAQEAEQALREIEGELREVSNKLSALDKTVHERSMQKRDFEIQAGWIRKNLLNEYAIDIDELEFDEEMSALDAESAKVKLDRLKARISEFGGVDPEAETKFNEQSERLQFMVAQRDDLVEAGKELRKTIRKLDNIARTEFSETFDKTRLHFRQIFTELFEGGEADLKLEEGVDILEADIIIEARPRGKRFLTMDQLSEGEKSLCALSLLFGLYKVKPSPFCMLDEVDAPLDDANVGRFLRLIRRFSDDTQFILITHNKRTMEAMDFLYGITMQEHGISKAVSLKMSELTLDLDTPVQNI